VWVEPELVAEVEYREWTSANMLRAPSYKGLREDRDPAEVTREPASASPDPDSPREPAGPLPPRSGDDSIRVLRELRGGGAEVEVDGRVLKLSNRDKVLYPETGFTKGDVIDYYARIAPFVLPHLHGRPLTLKRYPNGVEGEFFYEKQCPSHRPDWVPTQPVYSRHNRADIVFCLANDLPTLVWLANLADLELHTSLALAASVEQPTMMVFDLDPGPPADVLECADVALWLRDAFAALGLRTFVKTSGSKGLQAYVPLNEPVTYEQTKPFARAVAELLEKHHPDRVVSRMTKSLRPGKVLVDWSQNDEHKTTVCVYSLRARERPTVSTPVEWEEVERAAAERDADLLTFDADAVLRRADERGDLFAELLTLRQPLPDLARRR
jgi:bifunctional non-homologous end joining protein LigD